MNIIKNLQPYIVTNQDSIRYALEKIETSKHKIVYVVDSKNRLLGSFADGDFRRAIIQNKIENIDAPVVSVFNVPCRFANINTTNQEISELLETGLVSLPLIDDANHIIAIVEQGNKFITINNRRISDEDPCYVIAEIGNNHQGDISVAKQLIDVAVAASADCAKFQMRTMDSLYGPKSLRKTSSDLGAEYTLDLLESYQLEDNELFQLFDYCTSKNITPLCTPWDHSSLEKLETYGMGAYKVASADFTNYPLLEEIAKTGKPMLCSTGMASEDEINAGIEFLERKRAIYILLHCNSTYPTPFKDVNLKYIPRLQDKSSSIVGYSGHERGTSVPIAAVVMGAKIIEKHITLDKNQPGPDHRVSLLPEELVSLIQGIRNVEEALGCNKDRTISQGEMINRDVLAKSIVALNPIAKGQLIRRSDVSIIGPGQGMQPHRLAELLKTKSLRDLAAGDFFYDSDIDGLNTKKQRYNFNRPYGIPVRFHDFKSLTEDIKLDFVEFHLSYNDLDINYSKLLPNQSDIGFAVHAPELFANDHLLDLAADEKKYRLQSIYELNRVIQATKDMGKIFHKTSKPVVVLNAGGWNRESFLTHDQSKLKYQLLKSSLDAIDQQNVAIAIQTMPPFPWHFGGQSFHNLFVNPDDIVTFCEETGYKICLDISHSMLACNYYNWDFYTFVEKIAEHVIHLHIVDAKGSDGEGVRIGEGDIDFVRLGVLLEKHMPNIQFIPEIWQGHNNDGEGFWQALSYLENSFN